MSFKEVTANCGCVIEMDLSHDWDSGVTDAEDVSIISMCDKHSAATLTAPLKEAGDTFKPIYMKHTQDAVNANFQMCGCDYCEAYRKVFKEETP